MTDDSLTQKFRSDFPAIIESCERVGGHTLTVLEEFDSVGGVGRVGAVIIRKVANQRGFGLVWRIDEKRLEGLRSRRYDAENPNGPASRHFLEELRRRLSVDGASLHSIEGGAEYSLACLDEAMRGSRRGRRYAPRPSRALAEELLRRAY